RRCRGDVRRPGRQAGLRADVVQGLSEISLRLEEFGRQAQLLVLETVVVTIRLVLAGIFASLLMSGVASAQQAADAPVRPDVKTVGDWEVRCFAVKNTHPCDVFQEMANKDSRQRILSVSLA